MDFLEHFLVERTFEKADVFYGCQREEAEDSSRGAGYGCCGGSAAARGD